MSIRGHQNPHPHVSWLNIIIGTCPAMLFKSFLIFLKLYNLLPFFVFVWCIIVHFLYVD